MDVDLQLVSNSRARRRADDLRVSPPRPASGSRVRVVSVASGSSPPRSSPPAGIRAKFVASAMRRGARLLHRLVRITTSSRVHGGCMRPARIVCCRLSPGHASMRGLIQRGRLRSRSYLAKHPRFLSGSAPSRQLLFPGSIRCAGRSVDILQIPLRLQMVARPHVNNNQSLAHWFAHGSISAAAGAQSAALASSARRVSIPGPLSASLASKPLVIRFFADRTDELLRATTSSPAVFIANVFQEEPDDEVGDEKQSRDEKSRHVLRKLIAGRWDYQTEFGKFICPFCSHAKATDYDGMVVHAIGIGSGSEGRRTHVKGKHAAYGLFVQKLNVQ